jgi:hypothetical protein
LLAAAVVVELDLEIQVEELGVLVDSELELDYP